MKRVIKAKPKPSAARDLFAELSEGIKALGDAQQGKRKLLTHAVEFKPAARNSSGAENNSRTF
jgi:hypothetical protein